MAPWKSAWSVSAARASAPGEGQVATYRPLGPARSSARGSGSEFVGDAVSRLRGGPHAHAGRAKHGGEFVRGRHRLPFSPMHVVVVRVHLAAPAKLRAGTQGKVRLPLAAAAHLLLAILQRHGLELVPHTQLVPAALLFANVP